MTRQELMTVIAVPLIVMATFLWSNLLIKAFGPALGRAAVYLGPGISI